MRLSSYYRNRHKKMAKNTFSNRSIILWVSCGAFNKHILLSDLTDLISVILVEKVKSKKENEITKTKKIIISKCFKVECFWELIFTKIQFWIRFYSMVLWTIQIYSESTLQRIEIHMLINMIRIRPTEAKGINKPILFTFNIHIIMIWILYTFTRCFIFSFFWEFHLKERRTTANHDVLQCVYLNRKRLQHIRLNIQDIWLDGN